MRESRVIIDERRHRGGFTISQQNGQWNTQTGRLDRRTMLHKRYMILRTVGQGGMGAVYQARDMKRQTICAIKEMSLSMVPPDERVQAVQNFKIEAKMLWGLNHPNLPAFHGFFTEGQRYFMVMEYVDGFTLEELLERNKAPFPERRVLGWARQLCDVLEYLHTQNPPIIFRDMKPGNIMLMRNGHIKLIDFGIARFFRSTHNQDTQLLGTPGFAPPEQYGKAQTDERSDIYSLAMTLFQLLTNTLSETGFGLKDIRAINPQISPVVARALENAASLSADDRYENVAAFRRALLGVGTFIFENGDQATTPQELAELCARYPEEASDYLSAGEIELWLREIGEADLSRSARQLRTVTNDPMLAIEQFLQAVMGPNARIRTTAKNPAVNGNTGGMVAVAGPHVNRTGPAGWFSRKPPSPIQIAPRTLDFGQLYPGISAPLAFTITGDQGIQVNGTIRPIESWIIADQTQFDGMSTRVNVRINTTRMNSSTHYTGSIVIAPDENDSKKDVTVTVEADVLGLTPASQPMKRGGGKTVGADLDDDDDDDLLSASGLMMAAQQNGAQAANGSRGPAFANVDRDSEYKKKYGQPGLNGAYSNGWDPLAASPKQRLWMQRGFTFVAALMLASLCYTIVAQLPALVHQVPLPPNPWYLLVLVAMVPMSTAGALLVNWSGTRKDAINRACTGIGSAFVTLAVTKIVWLIAAYAGLPTAQLVTMLLVTALGATIGIHPIVSERIVAGILWSLTHMRSFFIGLAVIVGGTLGFFLTSGLTFGWVTLLGGILTGVSVAAILLLRMNQQLKVRNQQKHTP